MEGCRRANEKRMGLWGAKGGKRQRKGKGQRKGVKTRGSAAGIEPSSTQSRTAMGPRAAEATLGAPAKPLGPGRFAADYRGKPVSRPEREREWGIEDKGGGMGIKKKPSEEGFFKGATTYSPRCYPSTICANGLNFSVRNGKRCTPLL